MHGTPLGTGSLFHLGDVRHQVNNPFQQGVATVFVGHFASPEKNAYLATVAFINKAADMTHLGFQIVVIRLGTELDFLELDGRLLLPGLLLLLFLLVLVLPVIHNLADWRPCIGCHFHKIKPLILGGLQCLMRGHNAKLGSIVGNYPYFTNSNLPVPSGLSRLYSSFLPF